MLILDDLKGELEHDFSKFDFERLLICPPPLSDILALLTFPALPLYLSSSISSFSSKNLF